MGGLFSAPKAPKIKLPDPPKVKDLPKPREVPIPSLIDPTVIEARRLAALRAATRQGRASTILTGGTGSTTSSPSYVNTLLGE
jgi:hypothetical protein